MIHLEEGLVSFCIHAMENISHLKIETTDIDRCTAREAEAVHFSQTAYVFVIKVDLQCSLIHGLSTTRPVF